MAWIRLERSADAPARHRWRRRSTVAAEALLPWECLKNNKILIHAKLSAKVKTYKHHYPCFLCVQRFAHFPTILGCKWGAPQESRKDWVRQIMANRWRKKRRHYKKQNNEMQPPETTMHHWWPSTWLESFCRREIWACNMQCAANMLQMSPVVMKSCTQINHGCCKAVCRALRKAKNSSCTSRILLSLWASKWVNTVEHSHTVSLYLGCVRILYTKIISNQRSSIKAKDCSSDISRSSSTLIG